MANSEKLPTLLISVAVRKIDGDHGRKVGEQKLSWEGEEGAER